MYDKNTKKQWLVGVDEAGKGPLAGPVSLGVYAVNVQCSMDFLQGIKDSKKLSQKQREEWYKIVTTNDTARFSVAFTSAKKIDKHGIVWAVNDALRRALHKIDVEPSACEVFLDGGLQAPHEYLNQKTIIKGDATIPVISAGAIVAKVSRDKKMITASKKYPEYGFEKHKGYGTLAHRQAIQKNGPSDLHRLTFCKNILKKCDS